MEKALNDKVALVTGGSRGLGRAIADQFAAAGATVAIGDVQEEEGTELAETISAKGGAAEFLPLDVASEAAWEEVVAGLLDRHGRIDVLVNNAGVIDSESIVDEAIETWHRVLSINLTGVFLGMRMVLPGMCERRSGSIVNTSSTWGLVGAHGSAGYHASKGGVTVLTKNAAVTYAEYGIRVNSVHPGPMQTTIADIVGDEVMAAAAAATPLGRVADPAEVAGAYVYLASDAASFTTGASLPVDGGYTAI